MRATTSATRWVPGSACTWPWPVPIWCDRLVLVSGTAGIDDPDERAERRRADDALADRLDPLGRRATG